MKIKTGILFAFLGCFFIQSCEETELNDYYVEPKADLQLSESKVYVFEPVTFVNESEGQQFVLYTGAPGSEYDSIETTFDIGIQPNYGKKDFRISYTEPGNYKVSLLASGYKNNEKETVTDVVHQELIVTDTAKTIEGMVFEKMYGILRFDRDLIVTYKEFSHEPTINGEYLTLEMYSPWNPNIITPTYVPLGNPKNTPFAPTFNLNSNYLDIEIEGLEESLTSVSNGVAKVDFSDGVDMYVPKKIIVHPFEGEPNEYTLCLLQIPQFETISIDGIGGVITYDLTDSHRFFFDVKAPAGTDIADMPLVFENYQSGVQVSSNGNPIASGDVLPLVRDPSYPGLVYTATLDAYFEQPDYENIYNISSQTVVTVTIE